MMNSEQIQKLLEAEESETLERKQSLDKEGICKSIIAFANDMYGRGTGWIVVGQAPNKVIVGLQVSDDEAQRTISDLARNNCSPAVPVSIECHEKDGKRFAIVEVRPSPARPHFTGKAWVRMGSTTRTATDAEIVLLRAVEADRKVALLKRWFDEGKRTVILWQLAKSGEDLARSPGVQQATLLEVNSDWIVIDISGTQRAFPYSEFNVGYEPQQGLPQIRYHGGR